MSNKETPKWVKDAKGIYFISFHGVHWYVDFYGAGISAIDWTDFSTVVADQAAVEEFVREHPCPAAA